MNPFFPGTREYGFVSSKTQAGHDLWHKIPGRREKNNTNDIHRRGPDDAGDVKQENLRPGKDKHAAKDHKYDEATMEHHHPIGEHLVGGYISHAIRIGR